MSRSAFIRGGAAAALLLAINPGCKREPNALEGAETTEQRLTKEVMEHLNRPGNVAWKGVDQISPKNDYKCADGREKEGAGGTFGGGVGRFLTQLMALQKTLGRRLKKNEIDGLLNEAMQEGLYMHTDHHGMKRLADKLGKDHEQMKDVLRDPHHRDDVLKAMFDNKDDCACVGCAHLRFMAAKGHEYGPDMDANLAQYVLRQVTIKFLEGDEHVRNEELEDEHREICLLEVDGPDESKEIPMIRHSDGQTQMFVVNRALERRMDASFLAWCKKAGIEIDEHALRGTITGLAAQHMGATVKLLEAGAQKHWPVVTTQFDSNARTIAVKNVSL